MGIKEMRMSWQNRIIGYQTKPASAFKANPLNWRTHPNVQREALRGLLGEVGWVGAVLENKRTGNLIDGHARIEEALSKDENAPIPYLLVDLSPEEERLVLASFDPISALANSDKERLELLLKDLSSSSEAVNHLLEEISGKFTANDPNEHWRGMPEFESKDLTAWKSIHVHFNSAQSMDAFAKIVGQPLTENTRSIWYPPAEIGRYADKRYIDES